MLKQLLIIACAVLLQSAAFAANKYVRAGASGAGTGNNWIDAYPSMAAVSWTSGNTYWVAGGTYTGYNVPVDNVAINRAVATSSACTGAAGWSAAYDSLVTFTGTTQNLIFIQQNGVTLDGMVPLGIKVFGQRPYSGDLTDQSSCIYIIGNNNTVRNVETITLGNFAQWYAGIKLGLTSAGISTSNTISRCYLHKSTQGIFSAINNFTTVEYTEIENIFGTGGQHNNPAYFDTTFNLTWRYNWIHNYSATGLYFTPFGTGSSGFFIYASIFGPNTAGSSGYGIIVDPNVANSGLSNFNVIGNTFVNTDGTAIRLFDRSAGFEVLNGQIRDNILYNASFGLGANPVTHDYNWANVSDPYIAGETHAIIAPGIDPFLGIASQNYKIKPDIGSQYPRQKGQNFGTPYNTDYTGGLRPAAGNWDMGAYQYASVSPSVPSTPSNVLPVNGAVNQTLTPTLELSAFISDLPQLAAQFQIYQGAALVWDSGSLAPTTSTVVPSGPLNASTSYTWQGRYQNSVGWSGWSTPTSFSTASPPATPTNLTPANGAVNVVLNPNLKLSPYSGVFAQIGSQFIVYQAGNAVWNSGDIGVTDNTTVPIAILQNNTQYTWNGRYRSSSGWSAFSTATSFTTTNNAPAGTIQWEVDSYSVGEAGPTVALRAIRVNGSNTQISANWATANGTAVSGHDYSGGTGTVTFGNGDSTPKTVTIGIINSGDFSTQNRTFTVTLSGGFATVPTVATVTIQMNPPPPSGGIGWTEAVYQTAYNAGTTSPSAYRFSGSTGAVGASYTTVDGTALAGRDYVARTGTVSFANGVTNAVPVQIQILNSGQTSSGPRYFFVRLSNPTGGADLTGNTTAMVVVTMPAPAQPQSLLIIQNPNSVILNGGVVVTNK